MADWATPAQGSRPVVRGRADSTRCRPSCTRGRRVRVHQPGHGRRWVEFAGRMSRNELTVKTIAWALAPLTRRPAHRPARVRDVHHDARRPRRSQRTPAPRQHARPVCRSPAAPVRRACATREPRSRGCAGALRSRRDAIRAALDTARRRRHGRNEPRPQRRDVQRRGS